MPKGLGQEWWGRWQADEITLNLASQPYVDLRTVLNRLRMIMLVLILLAIPLFLLLKSEQKKAQSRRRA